jgi:predicted PurR-regulated permease PerM
MMVDDRIPGTASPASAGPKPEVWFLRRVLIVVAVVALALLAWMVRDALLLTFAGVLIAALLLAAAGPLEQRLGLSRTWSLASVGLAIGLLLALAGILVGSQVQAQVSQLAEQLPRAVSAFEDRFGVEVPAIGRDGQVPGPDDGREGEGAGQRGGAGGLDASLIGTLAGRIASAGTFILNALSALILAVVGGFFLAADPGLYRRGVVKLLPASQQDRAEEALLASGHALRLWLGAQLISMTIVGTLVGLGTWAIGLPSPLALGLFAGLAGFVPLIGAVVGAVPGLLLALTEGATTFLWAGLLFIAVQQVESNMILPLVEKHLVSMPPALLLFAVVAIGLVFGIPGVLLAAPLTVVGFVLVKQLYVRDLLGQPTEVPGEDH